MNKVLGPLPSPEPITGHPVDLGPVVTASFSCHHLPISCGLDRDLQVTSDSDTSGVGLGEAAAWNSPGRSTVLVSFGNLPVGVATDGVPPPTLPSSPVQSPLLCYPGVPSSGNPTSTARHICKTSPSVLASTFPSAPAQVLEASGRCFSPVGRMADDTPADGWPGC